MLHQNSTEELTCKESKTTFRYLIDCVNDYDENIFSFSDFFQAFLDLWFKHIHVHVFNRRGIC